MKSRLLSRRELDALAESRSLQGLITALTETAYRKAVEAALERTIGMDCIAIALRYDLANSLGKIHNFYTEKAGEMVAVALRVYDIQNLKAILRGLAKQSTPDEIMISILPIGELRESLLFDLARSADQRVAIDMMATMRLPYAQPLVQLRVDQPGARTMKMELALDQWFYAQALQHMQIEDPLDGILLSAVQMKADLTNLLTIFRFAHAPGERKFLREWLETDNLEHLLVGPGKLSFAKLVHAGSQDSIGAAVEALAGSPYDQALRAGLKAYAQSALLSDLEKHLQKSYLTWMARQINKDPLGIGVVLGYLALKVNEVNNIRWISRGIHLGLKLETIQGNLEYPP